MLAGRWHCARWFYGYRPAGFCSFAKYDILVFRETCLANESHQTKRERAMLLNQLALSATSVSNFPHYFSLQQQKIEWVQMSWSVPLIGSNLIQSNLHLSVTYIYLHPKQLTFISYSRAILL